MRRVAVIGNGGFAGSCLRRLIAHRDAIAIGLVVSDPEAPALRGLLARFCADHGLAYAEAGDINDGEVVDQIRASQPDYLLSVYNMQLMKPALLAVPRLGAINFHNGPLPRYRGVNVYSWAIINGETEYGVTWHLADHGVDTGAILGQRMFAVDATETPATLMAKGFRAGVELLDELLPGLIAGRLESRAQDESCASTYRRAALPNGGRLSLQWSFERIERFVRGLDFRPLANPFVHPMVSFRGQRFHPRAVSYLGPATAAAPGRVIGADGTGLQVEIAGGRMAMTDLLDAEHRTVGARELMAKVGIEPGDFLDLEGT